MTLVEVQTELDATNAAIAAITGTGTNSPGAQSYSIQGRNIVRAPYSQLIARKKELERMKKILSSETGAVRYPLIATRS